VRVYIGIDPGPSTGIVVLIVRDDTWQWAAFQVNGEAAFWLIECIFRDYGPRVVAIEEFIPTSKAGTAGRDAQLTRRIAEHAYQLVLTVPGAHARKRNAGQVKPWASDHRLRKTKFPMGAKFLDARDAARHAMYAAVYDGKERDPLA